MDNLIEQGRTTVQGVLDKLYTLKGNKQKKNEDATSYAI